MSTIEPTGPTDHLRTVEYWKENYLTAIEVGQEKVNALRDLRNVVRRIATALTVPERICDDCKRWYVDWWADEDLWTSVIGQYEGSVCFDCFRVRCHEKGKITVVTLSSFHEDQPADDRELPGMWSSSDLSGGWADNEDERVRTYDSSGEPHDDVLRTKTGKVLTNADILRLAEEADQGRID